MYLGSEFGGQALVNGGLSITRVTAATQTTVALATTYAAGTTAVPAGTFSINGTTIASGPGETVNTLLAKINQQSDKTGVAASFTAGAGITLTSIKHGSQFPIQYTETASILNNGAGATPTVGANAVFTVTASTTPGPSASETFTGGQGPGVDGLTLVSSSGNRMVITPAGNGTSAATVVGSATVGSMRFQIGANANQAATFSIPSVTASNLGTVAVAGSSVSAIDVTNQTGATNAIKIIDDAIQQLATLRGQLGSFQRDFLESNIRSLGVASENMTASESSIRDADIAKEMTEYTKFQILRQSGMAVLAQANQQPQSVLSLLRGGG
jgi:flagellin